MRAERLFQQEDTDDPRTPFARDRDRVLYSSAFRRLGGVTQVVAPDEGHVFHNRLTHTLKVAQVARRLAERVSGTEAASLGGIDPEVVECAALIHDLGHPPFGHIAEKELDLLLTKEGESDGYEGNAQSFRIVTKLAVRDGSYPGLNLTRATLNAALKYPWHRQTGGGKKEKKFGAYRSEQWEFEFARGLEEAGEERKCIEAELMDWADDITYAVHDLEDFYRAGLVPLDRLTTSLDERRRWLDSVLPDLPEIRATFDTLMELCVVREAFRGTGRQRAALRSFTSGLIGRYIGGIELQIPVSKNERRVKFEEGQQREIELLKLLTRRFVIDNPALATQQFGKREVIRSLFSTFMNVTRGRSEWESILPVRAKEQLDEIAPAERDRGRARVVADLISSLSDQEAIVLHRRLSGAGAGSVLDSLPR